MELNFYFIKRVVESLFYVVQKGFSGGCLNYTHREKLFFSQFSTRLTAWLLLNIFIYAYTVI